MRDFPPKTNVLAVLLGLLAAACAYGNGPQVQRQATLRQISPQQLAVRLREFYPESQHVPLVQGDRVAISIPTAADHVRLDMSVRDRQVTLAGSPPAVQQLADLIQVWDADPGLSQSRPIRRRPPIRQVIGQRLLPIS